MMIKINLVAPRLRDIWWLDVRQRNEYKPWRIGYINVQYPCQYNRCSIQHKYTFLFSYLPLWEVELRFYFRVLGFGIEVNPCY